MRTLRPLIWFISSLFAFTLAACSYVVQPIETYTTSDGFVRMEHPIDWRVEANWQPSAFPIIALAGGEAPLPSEISTSMTISPGSIALFMMVLPVPDTAIAQMGGDEDRALNDFMTGMTQGYVSGLNLEDSDVEISDPTRVDIGREQAAYESTVTLPDASILMRAFLVDESFLVAAIAATDPNGSAELQAQVDAVVRSLRMLATPEEVAAHFEAQQ